ncbi:MAG: hypothetical protein ACRDRH_03505 [Pseudonocardia sp.]
MTMVGRTVQRVLTCFTHDIQEGVMPLLAKIRNFLRSPQGRQLTDRGRRMAADPRNRARARGFLARLRRR